MSASPGTIGGASNREFLEHLLAYQGANIAATFSLPSFHQNMQGDVLSGSLSEKLHVEVYNFLESLMITNDTI